MFGVFQTVFNNNKAYDCVLRWHALNSFAAFQAVGGLER
jgi:hypothetical protein